MSGDETAPHKTNGSDDGAMPMSAQKPAPDPTPVETALYQAVLAAFADHKALDGTRLVLAMTATHDRRHGRVAGANLLKHYRTVACDLLERMSTAGIVKQDTHGWWHRCDQGQAKLNG